MFNFVDYLCMHNSTIKENEASLVLLKRKCKGIYVTARRSRISYYDVLDSIMKIKANFEISTRDNHRKAEDVTTLREDD